mmetsp:Transcript_95479/g.297683  ORF Transcript_95479/g.297683 Transcript_95479/m.297683 type:complete len:160 (+) Transcript_95479:393-872(+)
MRLGALNPPGHPLVAVVNKALPSVHSWAALLAERVAATTRLPPRVLALGACALGLASTGALDSHELRPPQLEPAVWQDSLLMQIWTGASMQSGTPAEERKHEGGIDSGVAIQAGLLAEAACCGADELRHCAFTAVSALQVSLNVDVHPAIAAAAGVVDH